MQQVYKFLFYASIAQQAEHLICNQGVVGSIPITSSISPCRLTFKEIYLRRTTTSGLQVGNTGENPVRDFVYAGVVQWLVLQPSKLRTRVQLPSLAPSLIRVRLLILSKREKNGVLTIFLNQKKRLGFGYKCSD